MLEVANSARQPWSAYGDGYPKASWAPSARHFTWKLGPLSWGNHARTELGQFKPKGVPGALNGTQIWSGQQNSINYDFHFLGIHLRGTDPLFTFVGMDQLAPAVSPFKYSYFKVGPSGRLGKALFWLFPPLKALKAAIQNYAHQTNPNNPLASPVLFLSP